MPLNSDLSNLFKAFAAIMDIRGDSVFKSIAFSKVSRLLKDMTFDIRKAIEDGSIEKMAGIGPASQAIIKEFAATGKSSAFEEVAASVPAGLIPMLEIPSLGPKTIALLWKERNITNIDQLRAGLADGSLKGIKSLGDKKLELIQKGLVLLESGGQRIGLPAAMELGGQILEQVRAIAGVKRAELAGSLRRGRETIGDIDIIAAADKGGTAIIKTFTELPQVHEVLGSGDSKGSIVTADGVQVDLRVVPPASFGAALLYFTGSKDHNVLLRGRAQDRGLQLNEWGLYKTDAWEKAAKKKPGAAPTIKSVAGETEADVYAALDLQVIEPELREDRGEVKAAEANSLPKLITLADIRCDLHTHTTASDGTASIEEMAAAAKARGYTHLAITDHSKSQVIANGLSAERLLKHVEAIHKASAKLKGIELLAGCEVDILADGRLDYDDDVLKELDIVVISPHISLKQDEKKATDRMLRAIDNKYVNIVGHPTGRLIGAREGLPIDFHKFLPAAAKAVVTLEINAGYPRLDLCDTHAKAAIEAGCTLSIDTDAHSTDGMDEMQLGVTVARRAWATAANVINCLSLDELKKKLKSRR